MDKINFENLPSTNTPISAENLNLMQTNVETAINQVANQILKKVYSGYCDGKGTTVDTGISVNGGYGGMAYLIAYSFHTSNKDNTGAGLKLLRCGFDGNNYQITDIASSSGNASNIGLTFSVSSDGTLIFWNGGTGRSRVSIYKLIN